MQYKKLIIQRKNTYVTTNEQHFNENTQNISTSMDCSKGIEIIKYSGLPYWMSYFINKL